MKKGARLLGGIDMEIKHIQDHLMSVEEGYVRCFLIEGESAAWASTAEWKRTCGKQWKNRRSSR